MNNKKFTARAYIMKNNFAPFCHRGEIKHNHMKKLLLLFLCVISVTAYSQQVPLYSQYMVNRFMLNPAAAGVEGDAVLNLNSRNQWLGYQGAPNTQMLTTEMRFNQLISSSKSKKRGKYAFSGRKLQNRNDSKVGIGGGLFTDNNGRIRNTGISLAYAYHIPFRYFQLSMGLTFVGSQTGIDVTPEDLVDANDALIAGKRNFFSPDFNAGIYLSSRDYYIGISAIRLFQSYFKLGYDNDENFRLLRQYYLMGGYRFRMSSDFKLEPSLLFSSNENAQLTLDVNVKAYLLEMYWVGVSYRSTGAVVGMIGGKLDRYHFGYAFDYLMGGGISDVSKFGSHELVLGITFGADKTKSRYNRNRRF